LLVAMGEAKEDAQARLVARVKAIASKTKPTPGAELVDVVTDKLRMAHPEYKQRSWVPLRFAVETALLEKDSASSDPPFVVDITRVETDIKPQNTANVALQKLYRPPSTNADSEPAKKKKKIMKAIKDREISDRDDKKHSFEPTPTPDTKLDDVGGLEHILADVRELLVYPLLHKEVFQHLGVKPATGVLLHGAPGCGKTLLAHAIAGSTGVPFYKVAAPEIVSGMSGESEGKLRALFQEAKENAPSLLFLDEIDAITPKRDSAGREMERRIVAQMLTCMDDLAGSHVVVLGATNRPDALDPALRRAGRFDRELAVGIPDEPARARILGKLVEGIKVDGEVDCVKLAKMTPGFVGADLGSVVKEASLSAIRRIFGVQPERTEPFNDEELRGCAVRMEDFESAVAKVQPSARREGFTTIPDVTWDDVGAHVELKRELDLAICAPIKHAKWFESLGLDAPAGVLLYGPPGCGKTLLAKAVANASGANFIAVAGPELLNKFVGESERAVRAVFGRAAVSSPCVIFFDEIDSLCPRRSGEGTGSSERVVNQMLTEMDGINARKGVFVMAATNRPDLVDPAMLRPGRLDKMLNVLLPGREGRLDILKTLTRKAPMGSNVDLDSLAEKTEHYSGADLAAVVREATLQTVKASLAKMTAQELADTQPTLIVESEHFMAAIQTIKPSNSTQDRIKYLEQTLALRT